MFAEGYRRRAGFVTVVCIEQRFGGSCHPAARRLRGGLGEGETLYSNDHRLIGRFVECAPQVPVHFTLRDICEPVSGFDSVGLQRCNIYRAAWFYRFTPSLRPARLGRQGFCRGWGGCETDRELSAGHPTLPRIIGRVAVMPFGGGPLLESLTLLSANRQGLFHVTHRRQPPSGAGRSGLGDQRSIEPSETGWRSFGLGAIPLLRRAGQCAEPL